MKYRPFFIEWIPKTPGYKFAFKIGRFNGAIYFGTHSHPVMHIYVFWDGETKSYCLWG